MNRPGSGTGVSPKQSTGLPTSFRQRSFHPIGVVSVLLLGLMLMAGGLCFRAVVPLGMGVGLFGVGILGGIYLRQGKIPSMGRPGLGELDR